MPKTFNPQPKPERTFKPKKPLKKSYKPTGELALFREIARVRPHVSFVSGERITDLKPSNFHHCISKGSESMLRLESDNIIILTDTEHHNWHALDRENLLKLNPNWQRVYDLQEKLRSELIERK